MKKMICTMVLGAMLCTAAMAANGPYTVTAKLTPDTDVRIDGVERTFYNAQGVEVHPISYAGTTYVPLRSVGELMGKNVNWDGTTGTATIGGSRTTAPVAGTPDSYAVEKKITVSMRPDYTIVIDGTVRTFQDVNGKRVDPLLYNGSIYLPLRAIGEIMGKTVEWDSSDGTVFLSGEVTDFDTNYETSVKPNVPNVPDVPVVPGGDTTNSGAKITMKQAREIALKHAGRTAKEVVFVDCALDYDDGRLGYDIEFIHKSGATYTEYDYTIDAQTGAILEFDQDAEHFGGAQIPTQPTPPPTVPSQPAPSPTVPSQPSGAAISAERAKQIAVSNVPGATMANIREFDMDYEHGRVEYEVKIVLNGMEYEFTIDGNTGAILERDFDYYD